MYSKDVRSKKHQGVLAAALVCIGIFAVANAEQLHGSIHTTTFDGKPNSIGNVNAYNGDMYLAAGHSRDSNCTGVNLPDGRYVFQVTDSTGKALLSADGISSRWFAVTGGVIKQTPSMRQAGFSTACGSRTVALLPHHPTSQGQYKVWVTTSANYERRCGSGNDCGLRGFDPANSIHRSFQVRASPVGLGKLEVYNFYDVNANGKFDEGDLDFPRWTMLLVDLDSYAQTESDGTFAWSLIPGEYTVVKRSQPEGNWHDSVTLYRGYDGPPTRVAQDVKVIPNSTTTVAFGGYCTAPTGRPVEFWAGMAGEEIIHDDDLAMLRHLNLRSPNGAHFDPVDFEELRAWFADEAQANMAFALSRQLAAMTLSINKQLSLASGYMPAAGLTLENLVQFADASLGVYGLTPDGHPMWEEQSRMRDLLEQAFGDGDFQSGNVVSATPCAQSSHM